MVLQTIVITEDATIRQVVEHFTDGATGHISVLEEPIHVLSAPLEDLNLLVLDELTVPNYLSLIKRIRKRFPLVDAMVIGGPKSEDIISREHDEAVDYYFARPIETGALEAALRHRLKITELKSSKGILGRSDAIEEILEAILQVGPTEVPILIEGESGTGKDLIAQIIHLASRRKTGPFEAINCASLAEGVLESELFGHEKGAFTGAVARRAGLFERADGGTVFLDEVGEMSPNMQVRLLRVLESGEVLRVGGIKNFQVNVRLIAATNRNLSRVVREGGFRQDLFYRLKGVNFHLPPLRERRGDIPGFINLFILAANKKHGKDVKGIDSGALRIMMDYTWPGNIRELRNLVDTLVVLSSKQKISAELVRSRLDETRMEEPLLLPVALNRSKDEAEREMIYASILTLHRDVREILDLLREQKFSRPWEGLREVQPGPRGEEINALSLAQLEREAIQDALRKSGGNRRKASDLLGISERTLYRKIKEYGLI